MNDLHATRMTLITRLKDRGDDRAWKEFVEIYMPVVHGLVVRSGLQDADAEDVTQDVFRSIARSIGGFHCERGSGSFRGWLMAVTRSRTADYWAGRHRLVSGSGDTAVHDHLAQVPQDTNGEDIWEQDYQRSVFRWAADRICHQFTDPTWQAFWRSCVDGQDTKTVAKALNISEGAVYIAKCRVTAKLRETIEKFEE